jgi:hypothetical protein
LHCPTVPNLQNPNRSDNTTQQITVSTHKRPLELAAPTNGECTEGRCSQDELALPEEIGFG